MDGTGLEQGQMASFCEYGNEYFDYLTGWTTIIFSRETLRHEVSKLVSQSVGWLVS
jgi:hypothetical protein